MYMRLKACSILQNWLLRIRV